MEIIKLYAKEYSDGSVRVFRARSERDNKLVEYYRPGSIWKPKRNSKFKSFGNGSVNEIVWLN